MDAGTWVAFGMFVVAAAATILNIIRAKRETKADRIQESASIIKAKAEMSLGSIEAAERVVAMYGSALAELQKRVSFLEKKVTSLEEENILLERWLREAKDKILEYEAGSSNPPKTVQTILGEIQREGKLNDSTEQ